jgi:hypothetical protein
MRYPYPFAVLRSAAVYVLTNQFARRFAISVLMTGFDEASSLLFFGTSAKPRSSSPALRWYSQFW